jgi:hypothetical protein
MLPTFVLVAALSSPVPMIDERYYFPTNEGARRVLELSVDGKVQSEITETISKVESRGKIQRVTVIEDFGVRKLKTVYLVTVNNLFEVAEELDGPELLLKLGLKTGNSWELDRKGLSTAVSTVGEEVDIEVPAGNLLPFQ